MKTLFLVFVLEHGSFYVRLNAQISYVLWWQCMFALTSIRRVGCRAVEESWRASQVAHATVVSVAIHGAADWGVAGLLRRRAGYVTMRRHTTAAPDKPCSKEYSADNCVRTVNVMGAKGGPIKQSLFLFIGKVLSYSEFKLLKVL